MPSTPELKRLALKALKRQYPQHDVELRHTNGHLQYYIDGHCVAITGSTPRSIENAIDNMLKDARRVYKQKKLGGK